MAHGKPATIANEVTTKIGQMTESAHEYANPHDFSFKALYRDAEKLANADGFASSIARAMLSHLTGDLSEARRWLRNAEKWPGKAGEALWAEVLVLSNLGFFSEAASLFEAHPECVGSLQNFTDLSFLLVTFRMLLSLPKGTPIAKEGHGHPTLAEAGRCAMALEEMKVSEAQVRAVLDLAGEVLRKHNFFFAGGAPVVRAVPDGVLYQLRVQCSSKELSAMTDEVVNRMVAHDLDAAGLAFRFIPA